MGGIKPGYYQHLKLAYIFTEYMTPHGSNNSLQSMYIVHSGRFYPNVARIVA